MPRRLNTLAAVLVGLTASQAAMAELYISPVLRDTVTYQQAAQTAPVVVPAAAPQSKPLAAPAPRPIQAAPAASEIHGTSSVHGDFAMKSPSKTGQLFGKNVPLFAALENLVPNAKSWSIVFEPGTENTPVSWKDAADWKAAVGQISKNHQLVIAINENGKRIAVARSAEMAKTLAKPGQQVWQLKEGISLRKNLEAWAAQAGWQVDWTSTQIDYPIDHAATLVGQFAGKGGVVDRALNATKNREVPLSGVFYRGNNVVVIQEAGYSPERAQSPVVDKEQY